MMEKNETENCSARLSLGSARDSIANVHLHNCSTVHWHVCGLRCPHWVDGERRYAINLTPNNIYERSFVQLLIESIRSN